MFDIRHGPAGERNMLQQLDDYFNANWDLLLCLSYSGTEFNVIAAGASVLGNGG